VIGKLASLLLLAACSAGPAPAVEPAAPRGEELAFAFGTLDGRTVTGDGTRGRVTAILFVTTFDLSSQVAARRLGEAFSSHVPKFNALGVVLEAAENAVLVDVFRKSMNLSYPVAIADSVELKASEAFGDVDRVPMLFVLDRSGRVRSRHAGMFDAQALEAWLAAAER
jgi:hypothetical protein